MATILVTHGIPAEGFSLLSGEKIVIPKPLMQFSTDELAALIPAADAVVACGALPGEIIRGGESCALSRAMARAMTAWTCAQRRNAAYRSRTCPTP